MRVKLQTLCAPSCAQRAAQDPRPDVGHGFTLEQTGDEAGAFFQSRTLFPRHPHLAPKDGKCYPCVRNKLSPMSRGAQSVQAYGPRRRGPTRSKGAAMKITDVLAYPLAVDYDRPTWTAHE